MSNSSFHDFEMTSKPFSVLFIYFIAEFSISENKIYAIAGTSINYHSLILCLIYMLINQMHFLTLCCEDFLIRNIIIVLHRVLYGSLTFVKKMDGTKRSYHSHGPKDPCNAVFQYEAIVICLLSKVFVFRTVPRYSDLLLKQKSSHSICDVQIELLLAEKANVSMRPKQK